MMEITESIQSRRIKTGENPQAELRFDVFDAPDEATAINGLGTFTSTTYDLFGDGLIFLPRQTIDVEPVTDTQWIGVVYYGFLSSGGKPPGADSEAVTTFDTTGGTQHITHSRATRGTFSAPGVVVPDLKNAIGWAGGTIEGCDIGVGVHNFSETYYLPNSIVTNAYRRKLARLSYTTNDAPFRDCEIGEVLFKGATGSRRGYGDWEITFHFAISVNRNDLVISGIENIVKAGWDYMWILYEEDKDDDARFLTQKIIAVIVDEVFEKSNFLELELPE